MSLQPDLAVQAGGDWLPASEIAHAVAGRKMSALAAVELGLSKSMLTDTRHFLRQRRQPLGHATIVDASRDRERFDRRPDRVIVGRRAEERRIWLTRDLGEAGAQHLMHE